MEITGRGCCLTIIGILSAFLGGIQVYLLVSKLNGSFMSWLWVFSPIWLSVLVFFGIPILFAVIDKLIKLIQYKRNA